MRILKEPPRRKIDWLSGAVIIAGNLLKEGLKDAKEGDIVITYIDGWVIPLN